MSASRLLGLCSVVLSCLSAQHARPVSGQVPTFGTTVVASGFRGDIYLLPRGTEFLPSFKRMRPVGSIYTSRLNIPPRDFKEGFPGVSARFEWFAIDYTARFFLPSGGKYQFGLTSDDGSRLYIDRHLVIDNDGIHSTAGCTANAELTAGIHQIRVSYFQGPGWQVSLMLLIAKPGERWRVFDTGDFTPPSDSSAWTTADREPDKHGVRKVRGGDCWARN